MSEIALVCPHLVVRGVTGCLIDAALMLAACWLLTLAPPSDRLPGLFMKQRHIHLVACLKTVPTANHTGGWRHPEADLNDTFARERGERIAPISKPRAAIDAGREGQRRRGRSQAARRCCRHRPDYRQ